MIYMIVAVILVAISINDFDELDIEIMRYYSWAYLMNSRRSREI